MVVDDLIHVRISLLRHGLQAVVGVPAAIGESRAPTALALGAPADKELDRLIRAVRLRSNALQALGTEVEPLDRDVFNRINALATALWNDVDAILDRLTAV